MLLILKIIPECINAFVPSHNNEEVEVVVHESLWKKSFAYTAAGFLNVCQDGTNASLCFGIMLKSADTPEGYRSHINIVITSRLIFMT